MTPKAARNPKLVVIFAKCAYNPVSPLEQPLYICLKEYNSGKTVIRESYNYVEKLWPKVSNWQKHWLF